jgi:hypothetical protein
MLLSHTNSINKPRVPNGYVVITTQTRSLRFGCGAVQQVLWAMMNSPHMDKAGKDKELLIPYPTPL